MKKRRLGKSGLEVAPLAFGCNVFGWTVDEPTAFSLLDAFTASGCNLIDTADSYSRWVAGNTGGESETMIGNWLKRGGNRGKVVIATKVGSQIGPHGKGLSKKHIQRAVEDSLRRLQTDHIDLYQIHSRRKRHAGFLRPPSGPATEIARHSGSRCLRAASMTSSRVTFRTRSG